MFDLTDDDLTKPSDDPYEPIPESDERQVGVWIGVFLVAAAAGAGAYFLYGHTQTPLPAPAALARAEAPPPPAQPLGGAADPIVLPPLDASDGLVREMVKGIAANPRVAAWLASKDLIRNFTVVVAAVAEGKSPAHQLPMLRPLSSFQVVERDGGLEIDPASYARYDGIAAATTAIDPLGAARLYATLKPRIEEAYRGLGYPDASFDHTLERAIASLLAVPVPAGPVRVVTESSGIGYGLADPRIEGLTDAQKELVRTGPGNMRKIQAALREIALALGIKLPSAGAAH
jgi:hypothetical protein